MKPTYLWILWWCLIVSVFSTHTPLFAQQTTRITIDANEFSSFTAATPPVINASNATVAAGDRLAVDVDTVGTGSRGLIIMLTFG